jgi:ribosomal protein S18 acetylase RimI-like enzyme
VIRRLRTGDEQLHIELARRFEDHAPTEEQSRAWLADARNILLVAQTDNGDDVGFALAYVLDRWDGRRNAVVCEIEVEAACRSEGYGRGLVEELVRVARAADAFELRVEAGHGDVAANRLYEACGARRDVTGVSWVWPL